MNKAHEWMDKNILMGRYPDLYGFLILIEHTIPAEEIWDQLKYWSEQYLDFEKKRTPIFHRIIDETIAYQMNLDMQDGYRPCYCHKGCSHCCYQPVACTDEEAKLIYTFCSENKIDIDFEKIERQQRYIKFDKDDNFIGNTNWNDQNEHDQACVFLNTRDQTCMIWEVRPFVCRVHLAEKTDKYCKSINGTPDPQAIGIHYPACSYILSSIFTIHHDSIGKMMGSLLKSVKSTLRKGR